jgi:hypothetical protein
MRTPWFESAVLSLCGSESHDDVSTADQRSPGVRAVKQSATKEVFDTFDAAGLQVAAALTAALAHAVRIHLQPAWVVRSCQGWVPPVAFSELFRDPSVRIFDVQQVGEGPYALLYEPTAGFLRVTPSNDEPQVVLNCDQLLDIGGYSQEVLVAWVTIRNLAPPPAGDRSTTGELDHPSGGET